MRRADIDALRIAAVYLLILFHVLKVYDPRPITHIWSPDLIPGIDGVTAFVRLWHMPLLFLLAGWSAVVALRLRTIRAFLRERVRRILLPLFFGAVCLGPVIKYLELRNGVYMGLGGRKATAALQDAHGALQTRPLPVMEPYEEAFLDFLPNFYTSLKYFTWSHLWFLAYLFVFSVLAAPLLVRLAKTSGASAARPWIWLLMPGAILFVSESVLRPHWPNSQTLINDWANVTRYALCFGAGAVLACWSRLHETLRNNWPGVLVAVVVLYSAYVLLGGQPDGHASLTAGNRIVDYGLPALAGWFVILFLLGLSARLFARPSPIVERAAVSVLPVYILHHPVVVVAAYFIDPVPLPVAVRLGLILTVSVGLTLLLVYAVVLRFDVLRAGFGVPAASGASWRAALLAAIACAGAIALGAA